MNIDQDKQLRRDADGEIDLSLLNEIGQAKFRELANHSLSELDSLEQALAFQIEDKMRSMDDLLNEPIGQGDVAFFDHLANQKSFDSGEECDARSSHSSHKSWIDRIASLFRF